MHLSHCLSIQANNSPWFLFFLFQPPIPLLAYLSMHLFFNIIFLLFIYKAMLILLISYCFPSQFVDVFLFHLISWQISHHPPDFFFLLFLSACLFPVLWYPSAVTRNAAFLRCRPNVWVDKKKKNYLPNGKMESEAIFLDYMPPGYAYGPSYYLAPTFPKIRETKVSKYSQNKYSYM